VASGARPSGPPPTSRRGSPAPLMATGRHPSLSHPCLLQTPHQGGVKLGLHPLFNHARYLSLIPPL
jgi:hypothetical protein